MKTYSKMKQNNSKIDALYFSNNLVDWFWQHGVHRTEEYSLNPSRWLFNLYKSRESLKMVSQENNPRPATAIWGPSQTGKSTLVARYLDGKENKKNSALYWEGGQHAFFSLPRGHDPSLIDKDKIVLNPYNGGMDASACITRFTEGNLSQHKDTLHVKDPMYPVRLKFSSPKEIMLSMARGYDGQCDVLKPDRIWCPKLLKQAAKKFSADEKILSSRMRKEIYEQAFDLCSILEDLALAGLTRYRRLLPKNQDLSEVQEIILQSGNLLSNQERFDNFRNEILWDGSLILNNFYSRLKNYSKILDNKWSSKKIFCSLEATACFLDMDSYSMYSKTIPTNAQEGSKEAKVHKTLASLNYKETTDSIYLGVCESMSDSLFKNPNEFGLFQGLIQEVVIPINIANLGNNSFQSYLKNYDLLDFPGVERGGRSTTASKVSLNNSLNNDNSDFPWDEMFCKVLKRGKTASLFQGYSRNMLLDSVTILQDLDNDKPNAQDLITGVKTWLKSAKPEYDPETEQKSPLPLNCVLTWWAKMLNESPANSATILGKNKSKYEQLGFLSNPSVVNMFAVNDFELPRGKLNKDTLNILPTLLRTIQGERDFKALFANTEEGNGIDSFIDGEESGINNLFQKLKAQVENSNMRLSFWEQKAIEASVELEKLLTLQGLLPKEKSFEKDRIKNLKVLRRILTASLQESNLHLRNQTEQALKYLLNVNAEELEEIPQQIDQINCSFIKRQFHAKGEKLCSSQLADKEVCWKKLGFNNEDQAQLSWKALCMSIEPSMKEMVDWLRKMVVQRNKFQNLDFRRFLAVLMTNHLISPNFKNDLANSVKGTGDSSLKNNPIIQACKNRCDEFLRLSISTGGRKEQPGDDEIKEICNTFEILKVENI